MTFIFDKWCFCEYDKEADEIRNAKDIVPHSLMPWWRQIKPGSCQGIIGYEDTPAEIAGKILKELGLENEKAASIEDHDGGSHSRAAVDQPARSEQSIIKYDGDGQTIVWKYPVGEFRDDVRLVVREGQEAIVSRYGQITAAFGPGLHTVNVRACGAMECLFDLQTGGKTTYYMDIYFINMAVRTAFKWGLSEKMHFRDLVTGAPVELGVSGNISLRVADSRRFLLGLVGYRTNYSWGEDGAASFIENPVSSLIDHVVKSNLPQIIKKERIDVLELDENTDVISEQLRGKIAEELKEYGLAVPKFYVTIFA